MNLTEPRASRYREAYLRMAREARYRPQAPGMGHVSLTRKQLADPELLQREATAYAVKFNEEENGLAFWIGCSDFCTNRAFIWTIEAARALAGNKPDPWPSLDVARKLPDSRGAYGGSLLFARNLWTFPRRPIFMGGSRCQRIRS